jgi:predicted ester cyclase
LQVRKELEKLEIMLGNDRLVVEAETFVGLSLRGPAKVVDQIDGLVKTGMRDRMSIQENKACVLRQFEELWNNGQVERVEEFFAEGFMNFGQQYQDARPIVKHIVQVWRTAFPDLRFTVDFIVAEDDLVMCETSFQGTHLGEFPLIPPLHGPALAPNGKSFKVKHIHRFRLKRGKITEHFAVRDDLGMFQQLGQLDALGR